MNFGTDTLRCTAIDAKNHPISDLYTPFSNFLAGVSQKSRTFAVRIQNISWQSADKPLLSINDKDVQWWEKLVQYKSTVYDLRALAGGKQTSSPSEGLGK
ncbi:MAG: hypothetical protein IJ104_05955, partial [Methanobrevibacter sp.]|nr:hypothetical protein [Methanobrevibacter sp.]